MKNDKSRPKDCVAHRGVACNCWLCEKETPSMRPEYNDAEIFLTKDDWIEIYYALDARLDQLAAKRDSSSHPEQFIIWIARMEEIQQKIDHGQGR